ncbi:Macrolide export ATP-binding/permease protein MacB [Labilithrix luteola]|uniref:Macrolide export ATP-binding/permease protein MacB n=1 Tax=Labilithrix luteola TaxID=1391654 RepID=A0A0K1Q784_9BACT|nr:ABC transporter permease [Labilithrix luteola]AKV01691.1 Macrolide export ATP-binding/permease protein MacB [Labilithrix luteola]
MNPFVTLRIALRAVLRNKLRSFLTTLGIIIGVGAVIAMMAIGAGAKAQVEAAFSAMGTNLLIILPGSTTSGGSFGGFGSMPTLTWDDLAAIKNEVGTVRAVAPSLRSTQSLVSEEMNWTTSVTGTTPEYFDIRSWPIAMGEGFMQSDVDGGAKVVILGQTVVERLFGASANPVGQTVRIGTTPFTIIGVAGKKGQSSNGQDYDDAAFIPSTTFAHRIQGGLGKYLSGQMFVQATSADTTQRALADIRTLLRDRHHLAPGADDDFSIRNLTEIASAQQQGTETMTTLLASVAAVSLIVGGIGIMNIMLVSVTERTREIGVRMAIGAKPHSILLQFLIEALVLSIAGGLIGVAMGVGVAGWLASKFRWPMQIQVDVIVVSVGFSALVGIVFGLYPARKASQLDPIEALRYE